METDGEYSEILSSGDVEKRLAGVPASGDIVRMNDMLARLRRLMSYYRCAILEIETKFRVLDEQFSSRHERNPIDTIKSRLKSPERILEKLERRGYPKTIASVEQNLTDVAGVRVICPFKDDIYMLADCLLKQDDVKLVLAKDYIKNPKPNGYRSLHLILEVPIFLSERTQPVRIELQLRTIAMDFWASLEHQLRYKSDVEVPPQISDDLKACADVIAATDEEMQRIAKELHVL